MQAEGRASLVDLPDEIILDIIELGDLQVGDGLALRTVCGRLSTEFSTSNDLLYPL